MFDETNYVETTNGITILVSPIYSPELSQPDQDQYVFIYKVQINNNLNFSIKLNSREWNIVESDGVNHRVKGDGVIGLQPVIHPNEGFEYASQVVLFQKSGIMYGKYNFSTLDNGEEFSANVPAFDLKAPLLEETTN